MYVLADAEVSSASDERGSLRRSWLVSGEEARVCRQPVDKGFIRLDVLKEAEAQDANQYATSVQSPHRCISPRAHLSSSQGTTEAWPSNQLPSW